MKVKDLRIGRKVKSTVEFAGVPKGTEGEIVEAPNSWPEQDSVAIKWNRHENDDLIDWFSFDELKYLD